MIKMSEWAVLGGGPTIVETDNDDVSPPQGHRVFVNSSIRHKTLMADYWAIRDVRGFTSNLDHHTTQTLIIPRSWDRKAKEKGNKLFYERKQFNRFDKVYIPYRNRFYKLVFGDKAKYGQFVYTVLQAITFCLIRGASVIHTHGIDIQGQGVDGRQMGSDESKKIKQSYQELKRACIRQNRNVVFKDHGRYSDSIGD
jgi:hypothetical protein